MGVPLALFASGWILYMLLGLVYRRLRRDPLTPHHRAEAVRIAALLCLLALLLAAAVAAIAIMIQRLRRPH